MIRSMVRNLWLLNFLVSVFLITAVNEGLWEPLDIAALFKWPLNLVRLLLVHIISKCMLTFHSLHLLVLFSATHITASASITWLDGSPRHCQWFLHWQVLCLFLSSSSIELPFIFGFVDGALSVRGHFLDFLPLDLIYTKWLEQWIAKSINLSSSMLPPFLLLGFVFFLVSSFLYLPVDLYLQPSLSNTVIWEQPDFHLLWDSSPDGPELHLSHNGYTSLWHVPYPQISVLHHYCLAFHVIEFGIIFDFSLLFPTLKCLLGLVFPHHSDHYFSVPSPQPFIPGLTSSFLLVCL